MLELGRLVRDRRGKVGRIATIEAEGMFGRRVVGAWLDAGRLEAALFVVREAIGRASRN